MSFLFGGGSSRDDRDGAAPTAPTDDLSPFVPDAADAASPFSLGGSAFSTDGDDLDDGAAFTGATPDAYASAGLSGGGGSLYDLPGLGRGPLDVGALDLTPSFDLDGGTVDYLFLDGGAGGGVRKKSLSEQLTYMGGLAYLVGGAAGAAAGARAGATASAGKPRKLRVNAVLNAAGRRGALAANSAAVLALLFAVAESALFGAAEADGAANYVAAGALAGGLFKSTRGGRTAGVWALGGGAVGLAGVYASRQGVYGRTMRGML